MPTIGPHAFVMIASGTLKSRPKVSPTAHPGHARWAAPTAKPMANRFKKAAVRAAPLIGKGQRQHAQHCDRTKEDAAKHPDQQ